MSHEIDFTTGQAGIAYAGDVPWHGYGQELDPDADLDQWRIAAGLDWEVLEQDAYYKNPIADSGDQTFLPIGNRKVLLRSDTQDILSTVSTKYCPVNPEQVLDFYKELIDKNGFKMHTAGCLKEGKRIWALAEVGETTTLYGQDRIDGYLLLATSYDGTMATTARMTSVRVVCNNTLELAYGGNGSCVSIPHSSNFNPDAVKGELGLTAESWKAFSEGAQELAERTVSKEEALRYFMSVFGVEEGLTSDDLRGRAGSQLRSILNIYENAPGQTTRSAKGTAWGLVNAVTYFQDHKSRSANKGSRVDSAWFGAGAKRKRDSWDQALELVRGKAA